ncbi:MAG: gliding motility-associated ABC transporter permease subunit GldF [Bacteroidia bacterium]|nr:gliding motility-associated ABC transporter permease subunit GldF [Bacteroidia bacterium]
MLALLRKEIRAFLSSLIGYVAISVFLLLLCIFLWLLPGDTNILDNGFATIDPLFALAPWVFLFLIPAITMRSFADEKRSGTIELLMTRPLSDLQVIFAKFLAGFLLVLFSLLPTLLFFFTVSRMGVPPGIDTGGTWGSYIGLLFLAGAFVAIGIFASSLTDNQVIAFIFAVLICFFFFMGFQFIGELSFLNGIDRLILSFGINDHYISLSRGVVDSRDMLYFISLILLFILLTKTVLESRKWS